MHPAKFLKNPPNNTYLEVGLSNTLHIFLYISINMLSSFLPLFLFMIDCSFSFSFYYSKNNFYSLFKNLPLSGSLTNNKTIDEISKLASAIIP